MPNINSKGASAPIFFITNDNLYYIDYID